MSTDRVSSMNMNTAQCTYNNKHVNDGRVTVVLVNRITPNHVYRYYTYNCGFQYFRVDGSSDFENHITGSLTNITMN